jgi:hypothetical protein
VFENILIQLVLVQDFISTYLYVKCYGVQEKKPIKIHRLKLGVLVWTCHFISAISISRSIILIRQQTLSQKMTKIKNKIPTLEAEHLYSKNSTTRKKNSRINHTWILHVNSCTYIIPYKNVMILYILYTLLKCLTKTSSS